MMRRLLAVAAVILAGTAAQLGVAASANAGTAGAAAHYQAQYSMDFTGGTAPDYTGPSDLGYWVCSGVRVTNRHFVRDNFTCSTTATDVTATFSNTIPWPCGCSGWVSDYDGRVATSYEVDVSDGTVTGWAIYS